MAWKQRVSLQLLLCCNTLFGFCSKVSSFIHVTSSPILNAPIIIMAGDCAPTLPLHATMRCHKRNELYFMSHFYSLPGWRKMVLIFKPVGCCMSWQWLVWVYFYVWEEYLSSSSDQVIQYFSIILAVTVMTYTFGTWRCS